MKFGKPNIKFLSWSFIYFLLKDIHSYANYKWGIYTPVVSKLADKKDKYQDNMKNEGNLYFLYSTLVLKHSLRIAPWIFVCSCKDRAYFLKK